MLVIVPVGWAVSPRLHSAWLVSLRVIQFKSDRTAEAKERTLYSRD